MAVRKKYDLTAEDTVLLTVGRYHPKKGYEYIPKIAQELCTAGYNFTWLVVGKNLEKIKVEVICSYK